MQRINTLGALDDAELIARLKGAGLLLQAGPFVIRLRTRLSHIPLQLRFFYAEYPVHEADVIADFHVKLTGGSGLRRWWHPQAVFLLDGDRPFEPYPVSHALPLFEWGVNWCIAMQAHQYLMLHAANIEKNGRVMLLPAWPGAGKSTLCAALVCRGWRLFSDEFGLVQPENGMMVPNPRPMPLKNQSIDVIREFAPKAVLGPEFHKTRKGTVAHLCPPAASVARADEHAPPAWIVFPRYKEGADLTLEPIAKPHAFVKLTSNSFNYQFLGLQGFQTATRLVRTCQCYILNYSCLEDAVTVLDELALSA